MRSPRRRLRAAIAAAALLFGDSLSAAQAPLPLQPVADVPLGGRTTRLDYESIDAQRHLLFVAHLGDSTVIAFDTRTRQVAARIPGVSKVHGVFAIPALGRVYASATGSNEVVAIDEATLKITARVPAGIYPDGMAYAPEVHKLYVSDEHGGTDTVIDVEGNRRVATIELGGEIGNTQYDPASRHVFVNLQTRRQLAEIDPLADSIVARIDLPGADGNHGLLIDPERHLAFIACEGNATLLVLDLQSRKVVASFAVGADPDVLAFDPGLQRVYVAAESGVVSAFSATADNIAKIGESFVAAHAHVVGVDPQTHEVFLPLMDVEGRPVLRIMRPR